MEIANIIIAILALIVAIIAIYISIRQARKSDNIALMGLKIDFYNGLCGIMKRYEMLAEFRMMINAKNSQLVFPQGQKSNLAGVVLSSIGKGDVVLGLQQITNDLNFLDINKYLFDEEIILKIDQIIRLLNELQKISIGCLAKKNTENELQAVLDSLRNILKNAETDLMEKIKIDIATKKV